MWGQSLPELLLRGGWVMWPLLACSVLAVAIFLERFVILFRTSLDLPGFLERLRPHFQAASWPESLSHLARGNRPFAEVAGAYLRNRTAPRELRDEIVGRVASEQLVRLGRRLPILATIGNLAPMLGLLGTVTGLVTAFWQIEVKSGQVQPADLASGIWEALLTTVFGLVIAIPTIAAHHALDHRLALIELHLQWLVQHLNEWQGLEPAAAAKLGKSPMAGSAPPVDGERPPRSETAEPQLTASY